MTNNNIRFCKCCGTKPVAVQSDRRSVFCGAQCVRLYSQSTDDGYDAYRDSQYDVYNRKDWRWGSWDK